MVDENYEKRKCDRHAGIIATQTGMDELEVLKVVVRKWLIRH
jgi:hypothetical protein